MSDISLSLRAKVALEAAGFKFTHSLGQNFLFDEELLTHIARYAGAKKGANVLEIGPGAGMLTGMLAQEGANVVSVELDRALAPVLQATVGEFENVKIVYADALKTDLDVLVSENFGDAPYVICANLPYYITADFLMKAVTLGRKPETLTLLLQKEAAERIMSRVGHDGWCALSAIMQFYCDIEALEDVPAELFTPRPHVDSRLVRLTLRNDRGCKDERRFTEFIKAAFALRRKTLANSLSSLKAIPRERTEAALSALSLDVRVRGEALTLDQLKNVFEALS